MAARDMQCNCCYSCWGRRNQRIPQHHVPHMPHTLWFCTRGMSPRGIRHNDSAQSVPRNGRKPWAWTHPAPRTRRWLLQCGTSLPGVAQSRSCISSICTRGRLPTTLFSVPWPPCRMTGLDTRPLPGPCLLPPAALGPGECGAPADAPPLADTIRCRQADTQSRGRCD